MVWREGGSTKGRKVQRIQDLLSQRVFDTVTIDGKEMTIVTSTKLLGLTIANDLTRNDHITEISKKANESTF